MSSSSSDDERMDMPCYPMIHTTQTLGHFSDLMRRSRCLPYKLVRIVTLIVIINGMIDPSLHCAEMFGGCHSITNGFRARGFAAATLDVLTSSPQDDILSTSGFVRAMIYTIGLRDNALHFLAPPCSSWVFLSRGSTGRNKNNPLGNQEYEKVRQANMIVSRVVLLIMLGLLVRNSFFVVEQPGNSILEKHPRWVFLKSILEDRLLEVFVWMQSFGGPTAKGTLLYTNMLSAQALAKPKPDEAPRVATTITTQDKHGNVCVTGSPDLKGTQAYPAQFGKAVCSSWLSENINMGGTTGFGIMDLVHSDASSWSDDPWADAGLDCIIAELEEQFRLTLG